MDGLIKSNEMKKHKIFVTIVYFVYTLGVPLMLAAMFGDWYKDPIEWDKAIVFLIFYAGLIRLICATSKDI